MLLPQETQVLSTRNGNVLSQNTILKLDHYLEYSSAASTNEMQDQTTRFSGAFNFRQSKSMFGDAVEIFGCSQPAVYGVHAIMNFLADNDAEVMWINLREEAVIYINKRPFVLREKEHPFFNLKSYKGINASTLEKMEARLKEDLLLEAKQYKNNLLVHDELYIAPNTSKQHSAMYCWEAITSNSVQTPREVFEELAATYKVQYYRVPFTPEQAPTFQEYDDLLECLKKTNANTRIVFNCQLGKRRSTQASVMAYMYRILQTKNPALVSKIEDHYDTLQYQHQQQVKQSKSENTIHFMQGDYKPILNLCKILGSGLVPKFVVDYAIDKNGHIVNLRSDIYAKHANAEKSRVSTDKSTLQKQAVEELVRYYQLIIFSDFLHKTFAGKFSGTVQEFIALQPAYKIQIDEIRKEPDTAFKSSTKSNELSIDFVWQRKGKVLSPGTILKNGLFFGSRPVFLKEHSIDGVPNFRKLRDFAIYASATPTLKGFMHILSMLDAKSNPVCFLSLRNEPMVYINKQCYVLRDIDHPFTAIISGMNAETVSKMEHKLKQDILAELATTGTVVTHDENKSSELISNFEKVSPDDVLTHDEMITYAQMHGFQVTAHRIPIPPEAPPSLDDLDELFTIIRANQHTPLWINCHLGLGRSTMLLAAAHLIHLLALETPHHFKKPYTPLSPSTDSSVNLSQGEETVTTKEALLKSFFSHLEHAQEKTVVFQLLSTLSRLLPDGAVRQHDVDHVISICAAGMTDLDFREQVHFNKNLAETARTVSTRKAFRRKAAIAMKKYVTLIIFASYLGHQKQFNYVKSFRKWVEERQELYLVFSEIEKKPSSAIRIFTPQVLKDSEGGLNVDAIIENRTGKVLAPKTILKSDHFPGCQRKNLTPIIEGAPNFRKTKDFPVYGVAIPTEYGVENILTYLNATKEPVMWTSLREEPVLYVNGKPFVLRDFDTPFENIVHTGIDAAAVEDMEIRLKQDVLEEVKKYDGKILLHDEGDKGMFGQLEDLVSVQTPREVYESMAKKGFQVEYHRVPITDERAPEPQDFDALLANIKSTKAKHIIFNCQMGRGRTSTGVIMATLFHKHTNDPTEGPIISITSPMHSVVSVQDPDAIKTNYLSGNYKLINTLMRVLEHAKQNKKQVDDIIDLCSAMQNLRTSIYEQKLKALPTPDTELHEHSHTPLSPTDPSAGDQQDFGLNKHQREAMERGLNYLERYFLLIVFNEYLHEQSLLKQDAFAQLFQHWLSQRNEILTILKTQNVALE